MNTPSTTVPVELPVSLKAAIEDIAGTDESHVSAFLLAAAAERVAAHQSTAAFFAERRARANPAAALALLADGGGEDPRPGDELPLTP